MNRAYGSGLESYFKAVGDIPLLTREEEVKFSKRVQAGDESAITEFVEHNQRLVIGLARMYLRRGAKEGFLFGDLIDEGNIGLFKAAKKFDWKRGCRFATYAFYDIKQGIRRALQKGATTRIRRPINYQEADSKIEQAEKDFYKRHNRTASVGELVKITDIPKEIIEAHSRLRSPLFQEGEDGGAFWDSYQKAEGLQDMLPDEIAGARDERKRLETILGSCLDSREERIIRERFGLGGVRGRTLEEIRKEFGITRERVRQLEGRAIKKLKKYLKREGIKLSDFHFDAGVYRYD